MNFKVSQFGFTMLEMILALGLIALLAGLSLPIYQSFQNRNELTIATNTLAQSLRRAQLLARAVAGDSAWGVKAESGRIVVFKGASYAGRDTTRDELFDLPTTIGLSGTTEFVFNRLSGEPTLASIGTTTLTGINNESVNIGINAKGTIFY